MPIFTLILGANTAYAVSIEEAVRTALQTNPDVGIVAENQRAVGYELEQARAGFRPSLDLTSSFGQQYTNDTTTRANAGDKGGQKYVTMPRYEMGLTLSQMLFDGFATETEVARQRSRFVSASRRVRETSGQIGLSAIEAYLEALRQRELTELAEENVALNARNVELVQRKAQGGAATVADVQQARSRLASAQATLQEAQSRLRDADTTYSRIIGERPKDINRPRPPEWALPKNVDSAIALVLHNNATISVTKADLDTAVQEYRGTNSGFWPTISLEIAGNASQNVDGTRGGDYDSTALITMNYNLFNGGADINRRNEFIARIAEARQRYNRALRISEEEMRLAWNALDSARERAEVQQREVGANATVSETYRKQFDLGGRNLLELLDAENELFLSKGNLVTTEYLEIFAVYRILSLSGILLSVLDVEPVDEARNRFDPITPVKVDPNLRPDRQEDSLLDPDSDILDPDADIFDPDADILDPDADILDPEADILDPEADLLDPEAELLDPEAEIFAPEDGLLDPGPPVQDSPVIPVEPDLETLDPNVDMIPPGAFLAPPLLPGAPGFPEVAASRPAAGTVPAASTPAPAAPAVLAPYGLEMARPLDLPVSGLAADGTVTNTGLPDRLTGAELPYGSFDEDRQQDVTGFTSQSN